MVTLKFGAATSNDGFTSFSTASFNDLPPARIVRELIQNSLDAAAEAGETTAKMRFQVDNIRARDIPDLRGYANAFKKAVAHQIKSNGGLLPDAAQEVANRIENGLNSIKAGTAALLSVSDNGIGLDIKSMNSMLADGASGKSTSASGSYGVGHLAPMALSDIRYMLYGGLTSEGKRIVSGKTILASHPGPGKKKLNEAKGYLIKGFNSGLDADGNLYDFLNAQAHPKLIAKHLDALSKEHGHGCVVLIPVFNNFGSEGRQLWEIVSKVAAYNFAPAIYQDKLAITVREGGKSSHLDAASMESILEQERNLVRAARSDSFFAGLRPSGQNAYSILRAITNSECQRVNVHGDSARVNLLMSPPNGSVRIDLFRNGMWITDSIPGLSPADFANRQPFHAVITLDANDGGELHRLIRKAEGPMHDKLSAQLLSGSERETLKQSLVEIAAWIREQVPLISTDEYTVDDFLLVNTGNDGASASGNESFSFWGTPTAVSRRSSAQVRPASTDNDDNKDDKTDYDDNRNTRRRRQRRSSSQRRPTRPLPFRSTVIPDGDGKLTGSVVSENDFPEAWLTIRVDENTDFTCDRVWQDEDVSLQSFHIVPMDGSKPPKHEIVENGKFVKIQGIVANADYEVQVEYDAPPELTDIVERPVFRLEMHRPPPSGTSSAADAKEESSDADQGN